jgi:F0F1-type ATP synthase membrane subunit c/vacuolar-type H+-ATPase subunit K
MEEDKKDKESKRKYPPGTGVAIGIAVGVGLGTALSNLALGIALGVAIGAGLESYDQPNPKKLAKRESMV